MDWIYWILALIGLARGAMGVHGLRSGWRGTHYPLGELRRGLI